MDKKHRFTLHVNMDDFIPATDEEKSYIVQMRPSTTFFKDGVKRLCTARLGDAGKGARRGDAGSGARTLQKLATR